MASNKYESEMPGSGYIYNSGKRVGYDHRKQIFDIIYECENGHSIIENDLPPFNNRDEAITYGRTKSSVLTALCAIFPEKLSKIPENRCKQKYHFKEIKKKS